MVVCLQIHNILTIHSYLLISVIWLCLMEWLSAVNVLPQKEVYTPDYNFYHNLSYIDKELAKIVTDNPHYVKYRGEYFSRTGQPQHLIHVSNFLTAKATDEEKVKILFSYGEHAREFFPIESLFFMLYKLLETKNKLNNEELEKDTEEILDVIDLYIVVMGNPDGRLYVEQSKNYCWRGTSAGVDINRNFDWEFGGKGSSNDKKDEEYRGPEAFSEPETHVYRDLTEKIQFDAFVSFHSGIRQIYIPYADSQSRKLGREPDNLVEMLNLAKLLASVTGQKYEYGKAADLNDYTADGTVFDYMAGVRKIPFSYAIEMWGPYNHRGASCFDLFNPSNHKLKATLEEVYSIYPAFFKYLIDWKRRKSKEHLKDEPHETPDLPNPDNPYVNLPEIGNPDYVSLAKSHERNNLKGSIPPVTPGLLLLLLLVLISLLYSIHGKLPVFRRMYNRRRVISLKSLGSTFNVNMFST